MLKNPRVLILDEAAQKLDSPAEGRISSALERPLVGPTTVMVQEHGDMCRHLDAMGSLSGQALLAAAAPNIWRAKTYPRPPGGFALP